MRPARAHPRTGGRRRACGAAASRGSLRRQAAPIGTGPHARPRPDSPCQSRHEGKGGKRRGRIAGGASATCAAACTRRAACRPMRPSAHAGRSQTTRSSAATAAPNAAGAARSVPSPSPPPPSLGVPCPVRRRASVPSVRGPSGTGIDIIAIPATTDTPRSTPGTTICNKPGGRAASAAAIAATMPAAEPHAWNGAARPLLGAIVRAMRRPALPQARMQGMDSGAINGPLLPPPPSYSLPPTRRHPCATDDGQTEGGEGGGWEGGRLPAASMQL